MILSEHRLRDQFAALKPAPVGDGFWQVEFSSLGSACRLYFAAEDGAVAGGYCRTVFYWLAGFESRWSRYLADSQLSIINSRAGGDWTETDPELEVLLDLCADYHFSTRGVFDATSLPLSRLWDWRVAHPVLPAAGEVAEALRLTGWEKVERRMGGVRLSQAGMELDLGGVGKEFAVDCLTGLAAGFGITRAMVDLGGDIAVLGEPPEGGAWWIGLEDPRETGQNFCGIALPGGSAVATSGDYRRRFESGGKTFGHIIDSRTGYPVAHGTRACSVIAPRCTVAGLLSTTAMVLGGQEAVAFLDRTPQAEGCVWHQGRLYESRGFRRCMLPEGWEVEVEDADDGDETGQPSAPHGETTTGKEP